MPCRVPWRASTLYKLRRAPSVFLMSLSAKNLSACRNFLTSLTVLLLCRGLSRRRPVRRQKRGENSSSPFFTPIPIPHLRSASDRGIVELLKLGNCRPRRFRNRRCSLQNRRSATIRVKRRQTSFSAPLKKRLSARRIRNQ